MSKNLSEHVKLVSLSDIELNQPINNDPLLNAFDNVNQNEIYVTHPGERKIAEETWNDYISKIEKDDLKRLAEKVRSETVYADFNEFKRYLYSSFEKFKQKIGNKDFYIYLPRSKFGSEYVFTALLWKEIRKLNFIGFMNEETELKDLDNILLIDDAIYSGINLTASITELYFERYRNRNIKFNYYVVVAYKSHDLMIEDLEGETFYSKYIPSINELDEIHSGMSDSIPLLYFDHKVAGDMSTFYHIYMEGILGGNFSWNGKIENGKYYGMLLPYEPDTKIKDRLYDRYFKGVTPQPENYPKEEDDNPEYSFFQKLKSEEESVGNQKKNSQVI
jgi:hypothetical protein